MTHAQPNSAPKIFGFKTHDKVVIRGIDYQWLSQERDGHLFRRLQDNRLSEGFTHEDIERLIQDDLLVHHPDFFGQIGARLNLVADAPMLSDLPQEEQDDILWKVDWCRRFLRLEAKDRKVTRSDRSMTEVFVKIVKDITIDNAAGKGKKPDHRTDAVVKVPRPRTLRRWLKLFENSNYNPMALVKPAMRGNNAYFTPDELSLLHQYVKKYASISRPSMSAVHKLLCGAIEKENVGRGTPTHPLLRTPSLRTFQNYVNALPDFYKMTGREGKVAAAAKYAIVNEGQDVYRPLERVECDECCVDLQVLLVLTNHYATLTPEQKAAVQRQRIWLTAVIDYASKAFLAFRVLKEEPSADSAIVTLEMVTRDKTALAASLGCETPWDMYGPFESIAVDSAKWFVGKSFHVTVNNLGCSAIYPPTGAASARGTMERAFGTVQSKLLNFFTGRTFRSVAEKGDYDSEANASVTIDDFVVLLTRLIVDGYHNEPHGGLNGETPRNAWLRLTKQFPVAPPPTGDRRRHIFGINVERKITREGIRFLGIQYQSEEIQKMRRQKDRKVLMRVDRHSLNKVSVWNDDLKGWMSVPAKFDGLKDVSVWKWMAMLEIERVLNKDEAKLSRPTVLRTIAWLDRQAEMHRIEAELGSSVLTDEAFKRAENALTRNIKVTEVDDGVVSFGDEDWTPSEEFLGLMGIDAVVYKKTKKAATPTSPTAGGVVTPPTASDDAAVYRGSEDDDDRDFDLIDPDMEGGDDE